MTAYVEELSDEHPPTTIGFMRRVIGFHAAHGVRSGRLLADNGTPYRSRAFAAAADELQIRHLRTQPYTPRTNGKAEAMVKILINGWAYAKAYDSDAERSAALRPFLDFYKSRASTRRLGWRPTD